MQKTRYIKTRLDNSYIYSKFIVLDNSYIYSKFIVLANSYNVFRSLVKVLPSVEKSVNVSCCDVYIVGKIFKSLSLPIFVQYYAKSHIAYEARLFKKDENFFFF